MISGGLKAGSDASVDTVTVITYRGKRRHGFTRGSDPVRVVIFR